MPTDDVKTFVDALVFSWIVAATGGHAKNYSLLIGAGGRTRLAPLYDMASALPYDTLRIHKLKLAMKIGGKYRLVEIGAYHFRKLAKELNLDGDELIARAHAMAKTLPDAAASLLGQLRKKWPTFDMLQRLSKELCDRAKFCEAELSRARAART